MTHKEAYTQRTGIPQPMVGDHRIDDKLGAVECVEVVEVWRVRKGGENYFDGWQTSWRRIDPRQRITWNGWAYLALADWPGWSAQHPQEAQPLR